MELTASNMAACTIATLRLSTGGLNGAAAVVLRVVAFQARTMSVDDCATVARVELNVPIKVPSAITCAPRAIALFIQHLRFVFETAGDWMKDARPDTDLQSP